MTARDAVVWSIRMLGGQATTRQITDYLCSCDYRWPGQSYPRPHTERVYSTLRALEGDRVRREGRPARWLLVA